MINIDPTFFEKFIIKKLFVDEQLRNKVLPFMKAEYFDSSIEISELVRATLDFQGLYQKFPIPNELLLNLNEKTISKFREVLTLETDNYTTEFITKKIEVFFKQKMLKEEAVKLLSAIKSDSPDDASEIRDRITEILSFTFDSNIGLQTSEESEDRIYDAFHADTNAIPTGIKSLDEQIMGFHEKSLTLFLAATNVGKTLAQCAFATNCLLQNKKVLYITFEESEDKLIRRILSNIFDIPIKDLSKMRREEFKNMYGKHILNKIKDNLIIKEYPESSINSNRLRSLLIELRDKKKFVPDIVFVDYIGCMLPNRLGKDTNPNYMLKAVASEVRALSMEFGMPFVSALQANRAGFDKLDMDLTDTADSIGSVTKADIIYAIVTNDELKSIGKYKFILLKNRYGINSGTCFVNVDYYKMRLYDCEDDESQVDMQLANNKPSAMLGSVLDKQQKNSRFSKPEIKLKESKPEKTLNFKDL